MRKLIDIAKRKNSSRLSFMHSRNSGHRARRDSDQARQATGLGIRHLSVTGEARTEDLQISGMCVQQALSDDGHGCYDAGIENSASIKSAHSFPPRRLLLASASCSLRSLMALQSSLKARSLLWTAKTAPNYQNHVSAFHHLQHRQWTLQKSLISMLCACLVVGSARSLPGSCTS